MAFEFEDNALLASFRLSTKEALEYFEQENLPSLSRVREAYEENPQVLENFSSTIGARARWRMILSDEHYDNPQPLEAWLQRMRLEELLPVFKQLGLEFLEDILTKDEK
jgi:hypothetical protein